MKKRKYRYIIIIVLSLALLIKAYHSGEKPTEPDSFDEKLAQIVWDLYDSHDLF